MQVYISRLVENPQYWLNYVDTAEDPRTDTSTGSTVSPGGTWTSGHAWTYPAKIQTWVTLQNARFGLAKYNLRLFYGPQRPEQHLRPVDRRGRRRHAGRAVDRRPGLAGVDRQLPDDLQREHRLRVDGHDDRQDLLGPGRRAPGHRGRRRSTPSTRYAATTPPARPASSPTRPTRRFRSAAPSIRRRRRRSRTSSRRRSTSRPSPGRSATSSRRPRRRGSTPTTPSVNAWEIQFLAARPGPGLPGHQHRRSRGRRSGRSAARRPTRCPTGNAPYYMYFQQPVIVGNGQNLTDSCGIDQRHPRLGRQRAGHRGDAGQPVHRRQHLLRAGDPERARADRRAAT